MLIPCLVMLYVIYVQSADLSENVICCNPMCSKVGDLYISYGVSKERRDLEVCAAQDNLWLSDRNM